MPKLPAHQAPKLRYHRGVNQWHVVFPGESARYLGTDRAAAQAAYGTLVARWFARGRTPEPRDQGDPRTVRAACLAFEAHAKTYYVKRGKPTTQADLCLRVMRRVVALCGDRPAEAFGVADYKLIRESWIRDGLNRRTVNQYAAVVKRFLAWAVEEERVPLAAWQAAWAVRSLPQGRSPAPEPEPVTPVAEAVVAATLAAMPRRVADLVRVLDLTGMRPGELVVLRPCDIDRTTSPWRYTPSRHKTEHLGHARTVLIGPRAQAILAPLLAAAPPDGYLLPGRKPGTPLLVKALRHRIARAADRAGVPRWRPNQLRHSAGTRFRAAAGLEASQASLGHRHASTTEVYAERDLALAAAVVNQIG